MSNASRKMKRAALRRRIDGFRRDGGAVVYEAKVREANDGEAFLAAVMEVTKAFELRAAKPSGRARRYAIRLIDLAEE